MLVAFIVIYFQACKVHRSQVSELAGDEGDEYAIEEDSQIQKSTTKSNIY
jgi:hypothetical protein